MQRVQIGIRCYEKNAVAEYRNAAIRILLCGSFVAIDPDLSAGTCVEGVDFVAGCDVHHTVVYYGACFEPTCAFQMIRPFRNEIRDVLPIDPSEGTVAQTAVVTVIGEPVLGGALENIAIANLRPKTKGEQQK